MSKKVTSNLEKAVPTGAKLESNPENDYESQGHLRTLIEAHGIVNDPVKMERVHKLAGRHHKAITGIQDLKNTYNEGMKAKGKTGKFQTAMLGAAPDTENEGD